MLSLLLFLDNKYFKNDSDFVELNELQIYRFTVFVSEPELQNKYSSLLWGEETVY